MELKEIIKTRFGGKLDSGDHCEDGVACILEACSVVRAIPWTDDPRAVGLPDMRPLNDAGWSSPELRARHMTEVAEALWDWPDWPAAKQIEWARRVVLRTGREILPIALDAAGLTEHAEACRNATSLKSLRAAAAAAREAAAAARAAVWAAEAAAKAAKAAKAAEAAEAAAWAAQAAAAAAAWAAQAAAVASDDVLIAACRIWIEEVR